MLLHPARQSVVLLLIVLGPALLSNRVSAATPADQQQVRSREFLEHHLLVRGDDTNVELPFSFLFGGQSARDVLAGWARSYATRPLDGNRTQHTITWTDAGTGLVVRCEGVAYSQFPVVEWTLYFRNTGNTATPILESIQPLDVDWECDAESAVVLHHAVGSPANGSDYGPLETVLQPGGHKRISAAGGRPTNTDLSYFNLQWDGTGVILAVGWPGQWAAEFTRDPAQQIQVRAGQELTRFKLLPGEEVRTPLVVLLFWEGDWILGQNIWRRWMMAHSMPHPGGKLPPPQFVASSSRAYEEMIGANEANQIMHIDRYLEEGLKLDYWWMDAGWYIQQQGWPQVGTWEVDPRRFPRGLRPISDHAHAKDVKILVWFEPERVAPGTWLYQQHPEWLLDGQAGHPLAGMRSWSSSVLGGTDPCVSHNPTDRVLKMANITWEPGCLAFHPGPKGEYSVVRFTPPAAGNYSVRATFRGVDEGTTTDAHILLAGRSLFDATVTPSGRGAPAEYHGELSLAKGDALDCVVGWGNGSHVCDSTGLTIVLTDAEGRQFDGAAQFSADRNPAEPWSYGYLDPGAKPDATTFRAYDQPGHPGQQGTRLLDLGNAAARQWLTDHIDRLLTEQGIDLYRQDFNMDPLAYWRAADAADRQGITEIKHVTGYLAYWDELRKRHPAMLIDTCASGGRRNDLETLRRAVPLWRSDYAFEPIGHQCMTYGISLWIPYHGTGTVACANAGYYGGGLTPVEPYAFWSNAAPSLGSGIDIRVREIDYDALRRLVAQWRDVSRFYCGDYYPLTPYSRADNVWMAWQFHRPELGAGVVQAFCRPNCPTLETRLPMRGLTQDATYELTELDSGAVSVQPGRELMRNGLAVTAQERPAVANVKYRRVDGP